MEFFDTVKFVKVSFIFRNIRFDVVSFINMLIKPHRSITDQVTYQRIRFLNSVNILMLILVLTLFISRLLTSGKIFSSLVLLPLILNIFALILYGISKSKYYRLAFGILFSIFIVGIWLDIPIYAEFPDAEQFLLNATLVLGIGIVLAGLILEIKYFSIIAITYLIDLVLFYNYLGYPIDWIMPKFLFLLGISIITVIGLNFRSRTYRTLIIKSKELEIEKIKAENADNAKTQFLANVSHDLRTPLNIISGYSEILKNELKEEKQISYLESIKDATNSLINLIEELLDINLIEKGKLVFQNKDFDLQSCIEKILSPYDRKTKEKGIEFIQSSYDIPKWINGDERRFRQIVHNLLDNSLKFTKEGKIKVVFDYQGLSEMKPRIKLSVSDTGIGIPETAKSILFDAFYQLDPQYSQNKGGVGLGLAIVKQIVTLWKGKIWYDSQVGEGTTFYVELPFNIPKDHEMFPEKITARWLKKKDENLNVLIVDDLSDNIDLMKLCMKNLNPKVDHAENGKEAFTLMKANIYSIIFMDIRMPIQDGYETIKLFRNWEQEMHIKKTPVVSVTAYSMNYERDKCLQAGFTDYLTKPYDKKMIIDLIKKYT